MTVFPTSGYAEGRPSRTSLRTEAPLRLISQTTGTATLIEWAKLALRDAKTQVLRVARVRQDKAFGTLFEQIVLPLDKFPGLTHGDTVTDVADLAERFGLQIERVSERITLVEAPGDVVRHLGIAARTSVVKLDRITETSDGEPIEWRIAYAWKVV
jgi:DNA-binding GntR family transcriptional regulator